MGEEYTQQVLVSGAFCQVGADLSGAVQVRVLSLETGVTWGLQCDMMMIEKQAAGAEGVGGSGPEHLVQKGRGSLHCYPWDGRKMGG